MSDMKYMVLDTPESGPAAFIFPNTIADRDMARSQRGSWVLGAGFFYIDVRGGDFSVVAYGRSESLNVDSRIGDSGLLKRLLTKGY